MTACIEVKEHCVLPASPETACVTAKINAFKTANKDYTSVKRFMKNNTPFWLFDNGSAFDAPQYMLNAACDTMCTWAFRANSFPCQSDYNLGDSTAVVLWKK
ncbi:MAG: hypothetical protein U5L45_03540 [Saprospiraceae bacterium]|nr:hypothetical protein [Saprospiraceae bacterium]